MLQLSHSVKTIEPSHTHLHKPRGVEMRESAEERNNLDLMGLSPRSGSIKHVGSVSRWWLSESCSIQGHVTHPLCRGTQLWRWPCTLQKCSLFCKCTLIPWNNTHPRRPRRVIVPVRVFGYPGARKACRGPTTDRRTLLLYWGYREVVFILRRS